MAKERFDVHAVRNNFITIVIIIVFSLSLGVNELNELKSVVV